MSKEVLGGPSFNSFLKEVQIEMRLKLIFILKWEKDDDSPWWLPFFIQVTSPY